MKSSLGGEQYLTIVQSTQNKLQCPINTLSEHGVILRSLAFGPLQRGKCRVRTVRRRTPEYILFLDATSASWATYNSFMNYGAKVRAILCAELSKIVLANL